MNVLTLQHTVLSHQFRHGVEFAGIGLLWNTNGIGAGPSDPGPDQYHAQRGSGR